jgi:hypothetical protein
MCGFFFFLFLKNLLSFLEFIRIFALFFLKKIRFTIVFFLSFLRMTLSTFCLVAIENLRKYFQLCDSLRGM